MFVSKAIALLAAMGAACGLAVRAPIEAPAFRAARRPVVGRARVPGEPGMAGAKLGRMAKEGRLTLKGGPRQ